MKRVLVAFATLLASASATAARAAGDAPPDEATERFRRGIRLFNEGDDAAAAVEFRRVYELTGRVAALYDLGLALAELKRPLEAADALERVLARPGDLPAAALANARRVRDEQLGQIASLVVETNVPSELAVDNVDAGRTPLAAPLRLTSGRRLVRALAAGYAPASQVIELAGGTRAELRLDLQAIAGALAQLRIKSALPGADVLIDDQFVGRTPLPASVPVAPGPHQVTLRRMGYADLGRTLRFEESALVELELDPMETPGRGAWGRVSFEISETDADVTVDGRRRPDARAGLDLPDGPHRLEVHRAGFFSLERDFEVAGGRTAVIKATLDPTEETRARWVEHATTQRRRGWLVLGAGALVAAGGAIALAANARALDGAHAEYDDVRRQLAPGGACSGDFDQATCQAKVDHANDRVARAESWRWVGPTAIGVGIAAAVAGAILRALADDPARYALDAGRGIGPSASPAGGGLVAGLSGAF